MSVNRLVLCAAAAAFGMAARPSHAQQVRPLTQPPTFALDQWTTADGLPQNSVNAIVQAPEGYLWIGTFGGLVRFDGTSFHLEQRTDSSGRHIDRVLSLAVGRDGALWIGTEDGLLRYRNGAYDRFSTANGLPNDLITVLHVDRTDALWIGTQRGLARYVGGRFERLQRLDGRRLENVTSIVEQADGTLWVSVSDRFVAVAGGALASARWRAPPTASARRLLLRDRSGTLWFSVPDGLAASTDGRMRLYRQLPGGSGPTVMVEDPEDGVWLGTNNDGLYYFQPAERPAATQRYTLPSGQTTYRVRVAYVDDEEDTWFGTNANGLLRARRNLFTTYTTANGLSHNVATAVYEDREGMLWAATNCGGLNAIDRARQVIRVFKPREPRDPTGDPCVFALTEGPRGTMWVGTWGGGLTRLAAGREERLQHSAGLRDSVVLALFTDKDGTVWVGTNAGGLASLRNGRVTATYATKDGLADNSVHTIYQTRDGALWIGTLKGLSRFADGRFTTYRGADGLSAEYVRALYEDQDGNLWIGTYGGGLDRLHDGRFSAITRREGLADNVVSAILEDDRGFLWMSGNRGIFRLARADLNAFANGGVARVHSILYGPGDGLLKAETNGGFEPAAWKDARGHLWFPTVQGLAVVDPARVRGTIRPPPVRIEEVVVNGVSRSPSDGMQIGPGRPNLEFRYTGMSLSDPQDVTFRYRLDDFDEGWVDAGTRRVAYYPRLRPGRYRFVVSAANRDGIWNEAGSSLGVRLIGPFWSTWWFRIGSGTGFVGLLVVVWWRRDAATRQRREAQEEFARQLIESQEHERKRIAGELHDGLGQELLVVKQRALMALQGHDLHGPARDQVEQIAAVVTQSLESVRGLAHNLTPYQLDHLGLSRALRTMVEEVGGTAGLDLETTIEDVDDLLPVVSQLNLFRIVQEALANVIRHSQASTAAVTVRRRGEWLAVTVSDDGRGFHVRRDAAGRVTGGFGLSGVSERARILGGRLDVISTAGHGTRIEVLVPVSPAQSGAAGAGGRPET